ncbi:UNVERIFIED_CONTAM: hypothetical protein FKN15_023289 [Acipenser sinensis]
MQVRYRTFYKPKYKVGYKTVTELEWRCCPGFSGEGCHDGPTSLPNLMPPFKDSMTPPGFKGQPSGHPQGHPEKHRPFPIGQPEQHKPFPIGHPEQKSIPGGHMSPGQKKSYYARKFQGVLGERLDRVEEELRRLSQSYESLNGMVTGLEASLRLSLREDTNKMLGSLLSTPPRGSDSSVGFGVIPDGTPEGLEGGEGFLGFGELAGKVTEVKDELRTKSQMLDELHGMVVGHDGQLKHLIEAAAGRPSPITSQTLLEELVDTKLAGMRSEILDGFEARLSGLKSQCEARIEEVQRQCQQEHLNGQHHMEQSLDGRETGLRKELGNLQAQIQGLTLTESCCTQVSSLSQRVLLLEEGLKSLAESQRVQQSSIIGQVAQVETFFDRRLDEIEARLNATEKADTEEKMKGYVGSEVDGFKTLLDEKLRMLEERLFVAVEELGNATAPAVLEGQAVPALETELEALRKQAEGGLEGVQSRLTDLETLCSSACPHAAGEVQKLHSEMEECLQGIQSQHLSLHARADTGKEDHIHIHNINNNNINNNNEVGLEPDAKVKSPNTGPEQTIRENETQDVSNETLHTTTVAKATTRAPPTPAKPILPEQTGVEAQEEEQSSGMTIFFSLLVIGICIILVHLLIKYKLNFLPESVAVVSLGILMGAFIKIIEFQELANWKEEEMFRPNMFFLLLLPPIIFESGYSLHKGNFFQNIGSITLFAVFGTVISAFIVGGGIYFLGQADVIYKLTMTESFAFGSLISAVDPVATIAIFNALNVNPVLNMLVFGESILNDAVSIVLTNTAEGLTRSENSDFSGWQTFLQALGYFLKMFFGSAALGTLTGLISALVSFV